MDNSSMQNIKPKKEINYQFKIMYVIGIVDILMAHTRATEFLFLNEMIHCASYMIAIFVFVSGYFYNAKSESNIPAYISKKFLKLIIPLYLWNLFYALVILVLERFGFSFGGQVTVKRVLLSPMTGAHLMSFNDPAWFIVPLFVTEVYNVCVRKVVSKFSSNKTDLGLLIFHFLVGFAGVAMAEKGLNKGWWLFLTRFMYFIPFFSLGYFYKNYLEKKDTLPSFWYFSIILSVALMIILVYGHASAYSIVIMDENFFENPVLPFVSGILGVAFYLRIARILTPVIGRSKMLNVVADNTFSIMMNHILGIFILKALFLLACKFLPMLPEFSMELFKNDIAYIYLPRGRGFPLLYVFFGAFIPIVMQKFILMVKKFFCK